MNREIWIVDLLASTPFYDFALSRALRDMGAKFKWVAPPFRHEDTLHGGIPRQAKFDGATRLNLKNPLVRKSTRAIEVLANAISLLRSAGKLKPLLHIQWWPTLGHTAFDPWFARRAARLAPLVLTVHNILPHDTRRRFFGLHKALYRLPDVLICHTEYSRDVLIKHFGVTPDAIHVIPIGPFKLQAEAVPNTHPPAPGVTVLFHGTIRRYKGIDILLQAWPYVLSAVKDARLVIAGSADAITRRDLRAQAHQPAIRGSVQIHDQYIPEAQLRQMIDGADVLVYPYRDANQSAALLTGLAAGKCVVATNVGGLAEVLTDGVNGLLVPPKEPDALGKALVRALTSPSLRKELAHGAERWAATYPTWQHIATLHLKAYQIACDRFAIRK